MRKKYYLINGKRYHKDFAEDVFSYRQKRQGFETLFFDCVVKLEYNPGLSLYLEVYDDGVLQSIEELSVEDAKILYERKKNNMGVRLLTEDTVILHEFVEKERARQMKEIIDNVIAGRGKDRRP